MGTPGGLEWGKEDFVFGGKDSDSHLVLQFYSLYFCRSFRSCLSFLRALTPGDRPGVRVRSLDRWMGLIDSFIHY